LKYISRRTPKDSEKDVSQCHFVHFKSNMDCLGKETGPSR
jgi:hypothetical protein